MPTYRMRQKFWSLGDDFTIQDEDGNDKYIIKGKAFSWGDDLSFQDMNGNELVRIEQKLMKLLPTYTIKKDGKEFAEVTQKLSWKDTFVLDVPGPNDYKIEGSFMENDYTFDREGKGLVATIHKKWFSGTDSYGIKIVDDEDDVSILATCVVIDQVCHDKDD
eukprot:CAMPEP_0170791044 /NCGR_PEP_ID=MMETSP0733-20121128/20882_1 /TAXON_ID=186038 /ORGANISM="Fragilariopsis kerguelensis, Strain L26-C5" /LENGTH=161 /DNA_ID=CAMNT_0011138843 /DNA_START=99 /DNA_END=584 /DNA_ORIENTATION=+